MKALNLSVVLLNCRQRSVNDTGYVLERFSRSKGEISWSFGSNSKQSKNDTALWELLSLSDGEEEEKCKTGASKRQKNYKSVC